MLAMIMGLAAQTAATVTAPVAANAPIAGSALLNTRANELFDRDAALKAWAIRVYDSNRDGWLTLFEAQPALIAFKNMADGNRDGRITTYEYDRAKEFIAAR